MTASLRALACPASLKAVLPARAAAAALVGGFAKAGVVCDPLPLADGGEGTIDVLCSATSAWPAHDAFGNPRTAIVGERDDAIVVEAAQVIPLDPGRPDVMAASTRPLGELIAELVPLALSTGRRLIVGLGGTANMDGGSGLLEVLDAVPAGTTILCDVQTRLYHAPRTFGPDKGATPEQVDELEQRFRARADLAPYAALPGSGASGGLGAAFASLGAELVHGAPTIIDLLGFDPRPYDLVVTGEGRVDRTTVEGKAPAEVVRRCLEAGIPCVAFGGVVAARLPGAETIALSGDSAVAERDLFALGLLLGTRLLDAAG